MRLDGSDFASVETGTGNKVDRWAARRSGLRSGIVVVLTALQRYIDVLVADQLGFCDVLLASCHYLIDCSCLVSVPAQLRIAGLPEHKHTRCPTAAQPTPRAVPLQRATADPLAVSVRDCRSSRDSTMQRVTQTRCRWMRPPTTEREACPRDVRAMRPRLPILVLVDGLAGPASPGARSA